MSGITKYIKVWLFNSGESRILKSWSYLLPCVNMLIMGYLLIEILCWIYSIRMHARWIVASLLFGWWWDKYCNISPGSSKLAAASNMLLFKMPTSSPTVQLVVPQSFSSSTVGLFPWATRPSNLLKQKKTKTKKKRAGKEFLLESFSVNSSGCLSQLTWRDAGSTSAPRSSSVWTQSRLSTCPVGPKGRTAGDVNHN